MTLPTPQHVSAPAEIVAGFQPNIVADDGAPVTALVSYPQRVGLTLHSLRHPITYECWRCGHDRESTMIAINRDLALVCPGCYATLCSEVIPEQNG